MTISEFLPEVRQIIYDRPLGQHRMNWGQTTPERLTSVIRQLEMGDTENFADLASHMIRTDPHLSGIIDTRLLAISSAKFKIEASIPGDPMAEAAADECRSFIEQFSQFEQFLANLQFGVVLGWAAYEHIWQRKGNRFVSEPRWIHHREQKFDLDWTLKFRDGRTGEWIRSDSRPGKFICHLPQPSAETPNLSGVLLKCAWPWLFKRWFTKHQVRAMELYASPFLYGELPPNADDVIRARLLENLKSMTSDQVAVFEAGTGIKVAEISSAGGDKWQAAIDNQNAEMTKGVLGSTLNTEISVTGGNRAAAESQGQFTMLPRMIADGKRLAGTIEREWFYWHLVYNNHLFGGQIPPVPRFVFELIQEDPPEIDQLMIDAGAVTIDELRTARGLDAWGPERGGDAIAKGPAPAPAQPNSQFGELPSGGADAAAPLASTFPATTPTLSRSAMTPIERALLGKLGVHTKRPSARRIKQ